MATEIDLEVLRHAVVHLVSLAFELENGTLDEEGRELVAGLARQLEEHRLHRAEHQAKSQIAFLVDKVLVPVYRHVQQHPEMTEEEVEARIVEDSSRCGFKLSREVLDDVVILADEINGIGPKRAAAEAMAASVGYSDRTVLTWIAEIPAFPANMGQRSGMKTLNMLIYLAGLLRREAEQAGRKGMVDELTKVLERIARPPIVAPPPMKSSPLIPPKAGGEQDVPD